jgi:hypothetical protein
MTFETLKDVERLAAEQGIMFTPADKARIAAAQKAETERLQQVHPQPDSPAINFADKFNKFYPRLLDALLGIGDVVLTFAKTLILAGGIPFALLGLLLVEHHRVQEGIKLFDPNPTFAAIAAAVLVAVNLILEFQVHHVEHMAGYEPEQSQQWSLRIWWRNFQYIIGAGKNWTPRNLSPAARYHRLLRIITFTILALALAGSMKGVISSTTGVWHHALLSIVTDSSLLLIGTWVSGLLFATAAVLAAQGLSRYVAIRCVEIVSSMREQTGKALINSDPYQSEIESVGASAALAILNEKLMKAATKSNGRNTPPPPFLNTDGAISPLSVPTGLTVAMPTAAVTLNGKGNHRSSEATDR